MFIIVDGPTCAGKSVLIEQLASYLREYGDIELVHKSQPEEHTRRWVLKDYVLNHENYQPGLSLDLLSDRWHFGEATYSPIYRPDSNKDGYGLLGQAGWRWVELFLLSRGALGIRLDAADDVLVERLQERGDDHVDDAETLLTIADLYRQAATSSPSTQLVYDTSNIKIDPINLDEIYFAALQLEALPANILGATPEYVGNPRPDVLLVGDKRNVTKKYGDETHLPFMPVDQSSGVWLLECLSDELWTQVGMVNGNDMTGDLRQLWELLGRPRPVALGNNAEKSLLASGFDPVEYSVIRHPAHARRFDYAGKLSYGNSIAEAATLKGTYA